MSFTAVTEDNNSITPILNKYRSSLMNLDQLQDVPDPEFLINGIILKDALTVLWGDPGAGKSLIAVDWSMSIATAKESWFGHAVTPGKVLYVLGEGRSGMKQRVNAWIQKHHLKPEDEEILWMGKMLDLIDVDSFQAVKQIVAETEPDLVVIDTLARAMAGYNENDTTEMGRFVNAADEIREENGAAVLLVHHPNAASGAVRKMRGSGALKGAIDAEFELEYLDDSAENPQDSRILHARKMKDAGRIPALEIFLNPSGESLVPSRFPNIF